MDNIKTAAGFANSQSLLGTNSVAKSSTKEKRQTSHDLNSRRSTTMQSYIAPADTVESKAEDGLSPSIHGLFPVTSTHDFGYCDQIQQTQIPDQPHTGDLFTPQANSGANFDCLFNQTSDQSNFNSSCTQQIITTLPNIIEGDQGVWTGPNPGYIPATQLQSTVSLPASAPTSWPCHLNQGHPSGSTSTPIQSHWPHPLWTYEQWQTEHMQAQRYEEPLHSANVSSHDESPIMPRFSPGHAAFSPGELSSLPDQPLRVSLDEPQVSPSFHIVTPVEEGSVGSDDRPAKCYAQWLWDCLMEVPDRTRSLREIYRWFELNTPKTRDSEGTGWQNSIRHNLSMNRAFEKDPERNDPNQKKASYWRLTEYAVIHGVTATTRYRKNPKQKVQKKQTATPSRQVAGQKGGQQTRRGRRQTLAQAAAAQSTGLLQLQAAANAGLDPHYAVLSQRALPLDLSTGLLDSSMLRQAQAMPYFDERHNPLGTSYPPLEPLVPHQESAASSYDGGDWALSLSPDGPTALQPLPEQPSSPLTNDNPSADLSSSSCNEVEIDYSEEEMFGDYSERHGDESLPPLPEPDMTFLEQDDLQGYSSRSPNFYNDDLPFDPPADFSFDNHGS